jgi:anti-anti-sigma regulatory factor
LKKKADVTVDGSGVNEVDSAVLQVLVSAKKSALTKGKGLQIANASPELSRVLTLTELDGIFGL